MSTESFVYVTYICTTPDKLWEALRLPEFTRQYWFGCTQQSTWDTGASWCIHFPDGSVADSGRVLEIDPPHKLVLSWQHQHVPELKAEGESRACYELTPRDGLVGLKVTHSIDSGPGSKFIEAVSGGWPMILSSLKSLLETGQALPGTASLPQG